MPKLWLPPTDPPGLRRAPRAPDVFDHAPRRNRGMDGISSSSEEWDNRLIATAVELGCPRWAAEQARTHPPARHALLIVWCDVQDAAEGDGAAKERLDYYRWCFQEARSTGQIADTPEAPGNPLVVAPGV
jgi:hypothetical protein